METAQISRVILLASGLLASGSVFCARAQAAHRSHAARDESAPEESSLRAEHEAWHLTPVVTIVGHGTSDDPMPAETTSGHLGLGGGALGEWKLDESLGFETGFLYLTHSLEMTYPGSGASTITTTHAIEVPFLLRYWFSPMFSAGAGGYVSQGVGSVRTESALGTGSAVETDYDGAGIKSTDFGLVISGAAAYPLGQFGSLPLQALLDLRYAHGIQNVNSAMTPVTKNNDLQVLVGARIEMN